MNTQAPNDNLYIKLKAAFARGVRFCYRTFIEPRSSDQDVRRRELIFNSILFTVCVIVALLDGSVIFNSLTMPDYTGFTPLAFTGFVAFFASLLFLSRKGHLDIAAYLFLGIYYFGATYGIYAWSTELPLSILSYAIIIVMASIIVGTRFGIFATALISATMIVIGSLEVRGIIQTDLTWRAKPLEFKDSIEHAFMYISIMVVSWLGNRETESSLRRALKSERELKEERNLLEKKVEERTRALKAAQLEKVAQLYRFAEFGRLSSGIFHDLMNSLTAVSLSIDGLRKGDSGATAAEQVERAVKASKRMDSFIQTVRKQIKSEKSEASFPLESEIRDALDLLSHKANAMKVTIEAEIAGSHLAHGSPVRFFQIAVNLVSNALDSYKDMPISSDRPRSIAVTLRKKGAAIEFAVEDHGCGIDKAVLPFIFDPFFTTKSEHEGTGLGLSTTKQIAENDFKGSISVRSERGKGSVFTILIPASR